MLLRHHLQPAGIRLELRGLPAEEHRDQQQRQQGVLPVMKDRWFDPGENALGHAHGRTPRFWTPRRPPTISCPSPSTASDSGSSLRFSTGFSNAFARSPPTTVSLPPTGPAAPVPPPPAPTSP